MYFLLYIIRFLFIVSSEKWFKLQRTSPSEAKLTHVNLNLQQLGILMKEMYFTYKLGLSLKV